MHITPLPKRPATGLQAWLATIGYLSAEYSADAALTIRLHPDADTLKWTLVCTWGQEAETVEMQPTLADGLRALWTAVSRGRRIFKTDDAAHRAPLYYQADQWLDQRTQETLDRLIILNRAAFKDDWRLIIVYQALDDPQRRVQVRLMAKADAMRSGGRGGSLPDACRDLVRNAAGHYAAVSQHQMEQFFADAP